jgi:PAS domain S-box-containing protein
MSKHRAGHDRHAKNLRQRAEDWLTRRPAGELVPDADPERLIHELQVHQVELQLQNEELLRSQTELAAARNRVFNLFDQAPVGFVTLDADGNVVQINRTLCTLLDESAPAVHGRPFSELVHPDDRPVLLARYAAFFRDPRGKMIELRLLPREDSDLRVVRVVARRSEPSTGAEVLDKDATAELLASVIDITAERDAEARNQRLEEQLQHAQKLESFGLFAGGIAHDFNNMLMSVVGHCDLALWDLPADSPAREHIELTLKAAGHAADVCRQLLAYAGQGKLKPEAHDLERLLDDLLTVLQVSVGPRVQLDLRREGKSGWVHGDGGQFRQLVTNLVTNAAEAYGEGTGVVTIRHGRRPVDAELLARGAIPHDLQPGNLTVIEVTDRGVGMDAGTRDRLFDPFFSTKFAGRGLGMAVVLGVVRSHGGTVVVDSAPGEGTTVTVLLRPHAPRADQAMDVEASPPVSGFASGATVLLIDDDERVRRVGAKMLEGLGLQPVLAEDGATGVRRYQERRADIDCVLLDLMMPGLDGVGVLHALRDIDPDCKVVIITGYHEKDLTQGFSEQHPDAIVLKPFRLADLRNVLTTLLPA